MARLNNAISGSRLGLIPAIQKCATPLNPVSDDLSLIEVPGKVFKLSQPVSIAEVPDDAFSLVLALSKWSLES